MGILSDFVVADATAAVQVGECANPSEQWPTEIGADAGGLRTPSETRTAMRPLWRPQERVLPEASRSNISAS
jgi:hypothetical protein